MVRVLVGVGSDRAGRHSAVDARHLAASITSEKIIYQLLLMNISSPFEGSLGYSLLVWSVHENSDGGVVRRV